MFGLQGLAAAVQCSGIAGLLVAVHNFVHVAVQTETLVHQSQDLLGDGGHLHAHLCCWILTEEMTA